VHAGCSPRADAKAALNLCRYGSRRGEEEDATAKCTKRRLWKLGYRVVHPYESVPRPFDVVEKGGLKYTVEVKGEVGQSQ